jgi:signal peptidase II
MVMTKKIFIIAIVILLIDQLLKILVALNMSLGQSRTIINNFFYITHVNNYGAAWGIMQNKTIFLIIISLIALVIMYRFMLTFKNNLRNEIAFGLMFGGIIGNLLDRIFLGFVRDFIDFRILGYHFPVFNISDMAIVFGVILLIIAVIKGEDNENNRRRKQRAS